MKLHQIAKQIREHINEKAECPDSYKCTSDGQCDKFHDDDCGHYECVSGCCHMMCDDAGDEPENIGPAMPTGNKDMLRQLRETIKRTIQHLKNEDISDPCGQWGGGTKCTSDDDCDAPETCEEISSGCFYCENVDFNKTKSPDPGTHTHSHKVKTEQKTTGCGCGKK
tara:strand:+ start:645 stop:1145 length:501 start_codon:yes stop_codon:yes gene_type:complete